MIGQDFISRARAFLAKGLLAAPAAARLEALLLVLEEDPIHLPSVRALALDGLPFELPELRRVCWLLGLRVLPPRRQAWGQTLAQLQQQYQQYCREYILLPEDYPIKLKKDSPGWEKYGADYRLWQRIERDTTRTRSELAFFNREGCVQVPFLTNARKERLRQIRGDEGTSARHSFGFDHLSRLLFVWAKLNPQVQYVQGLNQVLAPLLFLFSQENEQVSNEGVVLFGFNALLAQGIEVMIREFDSQEQGIHGRMRRLHFLVCSVAPELALRLEELGLSEQLFAMRWLTMYFAQDFQFHELFRVWDFLILADDFEAALDCLCLAVLLLLEEPLLRSGFSEATALLRRIEGIGADRLVEVARNIWMKVEGLLDLVRGKARTASSRP